MLHVSNTSSRVHASRQLTGLLAPILFLIERFHVYRFPCFIIVSQADRQRGDARFRPVLQDSYCRSSSEIDSTL